MTYQRKSKIVPWRAIGSEIEHCSTSEEALHCSGLDYEVEKRPLFTYDTENFNGDPDEDIIIPELQVPGYYSLVRTDTEEPLGVVKGKYTVCQNTECFAFLDSLVKNGSVIFDSAGSVNGGRDVFISAKLPQQLRIGKNDLIDQFLFVGTSHDGLTSTTVGYTPNRIFCKNMLNNTNSVRIYHTANADKRLQQAAEILHVTRELAEQNQETFNRWANVRITDEHIKKLVQMAMSPNPETLASVLRGEQDEFSSHFVNVCEQVMQYHFEDESQLLETTKGTVFGAYNAITGYYQNVKTFKNDEEKVKSILYGGTAQTRAQKAFELCADFTRSGEDIFRVN